MQQFGLEKVYIGTNGCGTGMFEASLDFNKNPMDINGHLEFKVTPQSSGSGMTPLMYCVEPVFSVPSTAYVTLICVIDSEGADFLRVWLLSTSFKTLLNSRVVILLLYCTYLFLVNTDHWVLYLYSWLWFEPVWAAHNAVDLWDFIHLVESNVSFTMHNPQAISSLKIHFWAPAALSLCFPIFSLGLWALLGHGCDSGGLLRHNANHV